MRVWGGEVAEKIVKEDIVTACAHARCVVVFGESDSMPDVTVQWEAALTECSVVWDSSSCSLALIWPFPSPSGLSSVELCASAVPDHSFLV